MDNDPVKNNSTEEKYRAQLEQQTRTRSQVAQDEANGTATGQTAQDTEGARQLEEGGWVNNTGSSAGAHASSPDRLKMGGAMQKVTFLGKLKGRKSALTAIITSIALGGSGVGFFLTTSLAPIAFFENIGNDLNDQVAALQVRNEAVFRTKIPSAETDKAVKGCTKLSVRCKFATLGTNQMKRLKAANIEVIPDSTSKTILGERVRPYGYRFQGVDYTAAAWRELLKTNRAASVAQLKANNMKFITLRDNAFVRTVLTRYGMTLREPELKGTAQERVNALLNTSGTSDPTKVTFTQQSDGSYKIDGDTSDRTFTEAQRDQMQKSLDRVAGAGSLSNSKTVKASVGALSALGYWDLACSIKNMLGAATVAAKVSNNAELVRYALPIATLAGQMKAGEISPENYETLGKLLMDTDSRQTVPDITNAVTLDGTSVAAKTDLPTIKNPNYGKNAMDSSLYQLSSNGTLPRASTARSTYSLGVTQNQLLAGLQGAADVSAAITNVGGACGFVQNGIVRVIGIVVAVGAGVGTAGGTLVAQAAIAGAMIAGMAILEGVINNAVSGNLISSDNLASAPVDRGEAAWTGMAATYSASAQGHGLSPASAEQFVAYNKTQKTVNDTYIAMESDDANPLDVYNQYSFLGSLSRSIINSTGSSASFSSMLSAPMNIIGGGFGSLMTPAKAASGFNEARFNQCEEAGYAAAGFSADVQCNLRFFMSDADMALDVMQVANWMEDNNMVEADTTTGIPVGYTVPDMRASQNAVEGFVSGLASQFVDTRNLPNDYAYYLEYCRFRTVPYGETFEDGATDDWKTGKNCSKQGAPYSYYRVYTADMTSEDVDPGAGTAADTTTPPATSDAVVSPVAAGFRKQNGFGPRVAPCGGCSSWHQGADYTNGNRPVFSIRAGTVISVGTDRNNTVRIRHSDGLVSVYLHMYKSDIRVRTGDTVTAGQQIGLIGNEGDSTGPHLHMELDVSNVNAAAYAQYPRNSGGFNPGKRIDPTLYLRTNGVAGF